MPLPASTPPLLSQTRVAIIGLGLMGGSLALALRGQCREVVGVETDTVTQDNATQNGIVERVVTLEDAVQRDLVILATPPRTIITLLEQLGQATFSPRPSSILLDLGSTKSAIIAAMQKLPPAFDPIGGHPMCGKAVSGLAQAEATLFQGKVFVLTPLDRTTPRARQMAQAVVEGIGARAITLEAERHDRLVAMISHLPYLVALALSQTAHTLEDDQLWTVAASGFRDTTRLATSDVTMIVDILLTNRGAVLEALTRYRAEIDSLLALVSSADAETLRATLEPAQAQRARLNL